MCGLLRHLREHGVHDMNFLDKNNPAFAEFYSVLDSKMKNLLDQGLGTDTKQADPISGDDENKLWESGVFGLKDSKTLQLTVFFYACKLFGLRGRDEHRGLQCDQFEIGEDSEGRFIRFIGRGSKTYHGGLGQMSINNKDIKHYCTPGPRCMATHFETYINAVGNDGDFYKRPLPAMPGNSIRYGHQPVGVNTLTKFMKEISQRGSLKGVYSNHSGKRTCATSMYEAGIDEQDIMDRTGHRSVTAVRKYKRLNDKICKKVSNVLDPNSDVSLSMSKRNEQSDDDKEINLKNSPCHKKQKVRNALSEITTKSGVVNFSGCTFNF
ncbi:uncharacterized protein LOC128550162 [Mercenaria mercenaria]|uniref:uncharacterized protein LOC128550162 n=1 Tax=Mercenaria mercenaria TaxID=6596 RepID=UPI00234EB8DD|nr:uncharacterized protein LOC128550162 [Mercenaria mercenaria]